MGGARSVVLLRNFKYSTGLYGRGWPVYSTHRQLEFKAPSRRDCPRPESERSRSTTRAVWRVLTPPLGFGATPVFCDASRSDRARRWTRLGSAGEIADAPRPDPPAPAPPPQTGGRQRYPPPTASARNDDHPRPGVATRAELTRRGQEGAGP